MDERLVLWDVDGTLLRTEGVAQQAFDLAAEHVLGRPPGAHEVRMSGKTDPLIALEILAFAGLDEEEAHRLLPDVLARLEAELAAAEHLVREQGRALPGVPEVLEALHHHPGVVQSLLTGNLAANAVVKIRAFGLDRWIDADVGAYGSDHLDRDELVPIALERVECLRGRRLTPADVWVVGDTPRDLACARAGGARCLLVATGRFAIEELADLGADELLPDLTDTAAVLEILLPST
ncbi:MAG TPA: haloacid dehalogenase-like hydrolase [Acidimicrobiales bacterium]|nr:haloacid dehalogenase-like hydrolase [Acidimicrobiales bacterium]